MPRIYAYVDQDLKEKVYDVVATKKLQLSGVIQDLLEEWLREQEAKEWTWTDPETGAVHHKPSGEPFPTRQRKDLPPGRPPEL